MNKAELSAKWGKYCDIDELVNHVRELLNTYHHRNTEHGVCAMLDTFFTNKEPLIKLITSSNHYIGKLRICTKQAFDRQINYSNISRFFSQHQYEFRPTNPITKTDDNGKQMMDYMQAAAKFCSLSDLVDNKSLMEMAENLRQFRNDGSTKKSWTFHQQVSNYISFFLNHTYSTIQHDFEPTFDKKAPSFKTGMKTSRAFNAFCHYYEFDKRDTYNKSFAEYADLVSPLKRNMDFIISVNPLDYLMMSNGVSWHSCHNINDGGWKGGTLSYMLDSTSIITYVVEDINSNAKIHLIPKYYRQMIHYDDGMFMQNRLYPAANDGSTDLYARFRGFVTDEFNEILNVEDKWDVEQGSNACTRHVRSTGCHYVDYGHNNRCNIFYPHAKANSIPDHRMIVGHSGICPYCGLSYTESHRLAHSNCIINR